MKHDGLMVATAVSSPPAGMEDAPPFELTNNSQPGLNFQEDELCCGLCRSCLNSDSVSEIPANVSRRCALFTSFTSNPYSGCVWPAACAQFLSECIFHTRRRDLKASGAVNLLLLLRALLQGSLRPIICALSRSFIKKMNYTRNANGIGTWWCMHDAFELQN